MKKTIITVSLIASAIFSAGAYNSTILYGSNDATKDRTVRTFQYYPTADGMIATHNGHNLYTRALYGGHSLWRLETGDRPVFAAYHKKENRNISFRVSVGDSNATTDLIDAAECTSRYAGGVRIYEVSDPAWHGGKLTITVVACHDREGAVWLIEAKDMPAGSKVYGYSMATDKVKLSRSGDLGVDPPNGFAASPDRRDLSSDFVYVGGDTNQGCILYEDRKMKTVSQRSVSPEFTKAMASTQAIAGRIKIDTPDPYINSLGANLAAAADGIWDGDTYQHGAIGWRMPLAGWRGAYTGDFLGWHDRARNHFSAYAESQVRDVPPVYPHPAQDSTKALSRADKRWGTQMYSNGYICRNPRRHDTMHHYDMNLCYIDELLWHLCWTGDLEYARQVWPVIKLSLEWEKRNYDPDDDGLYDAYCCIWASDALYYNAGGVTHSSAYNYRANRLAARIAELIGEDPTPYAAEAEKIKGALATTLWMPGEGVWAEFKDAMGMKRLHTHPAVWTIYHAIDSDVASPLQYYAATRYIDRKIPRFPIKAEGDSIDIGGAYVVSTSDWLPYSWSINNVAHAETLNTALAYWQARRGDDAYRIFKGMVFDGMFLGGSPGNIGQISHYDAARGESYRDFADPVGVMSRALVQGLYGFAPDMLNRRVTITPGFPTPWNHASIKHPDFTFDFRREGLKDCYTMDVKLDSLETTRLVIPARSLKGRVTVDGRKGKLSFDSNSVGRPFAYIDVNGHGDHRIEIEWNKDTITELSGKPTDVILPGFAQVKAGGVTWWKEVPTTEADTPTIEYGIDITTTATGNYETVDLTGIYNAPVTAIFRNEYISPRPEATTLRLPVQGIGEWCHPLDTANIDDSGFRTVLRDGVFTTPLGVPFRSTTDENNIVYTSLFDNYPDSVTLSLSGKARALQLMLAGSTNHMQCHIENARLVVRYTDGTTTELPLIPPYNWCPIEQDYYIDGMAFNVSTPRPWRVCLSNGMVSNDFTKDLKLNEVYGRRIPGGAATLLSMPLDEKKELKSLTLKTLSNDVVVGLMGMTYVRPGVAGPMADVNGVVDLTPDSLAIARMARPVPGSTRRGTNPVLFLVGNSTMRTGTKGNGNNGQWGWGFYMSEYFDPEKITVENHALGGMSTRTFYTRLWSDIVPAIRPGDYVVVELGHNDNGPYDSGRARATIPGIGRDSLEVIIQETGVRETVYTYGEYLRRFIGDIKRQGGIPVLMSLTPRNAWDDADSTRITRVNQTFGKWAREVAEGENVPFVDLNEITASKYETFGKEKVKYMFYLDRIHTSQYGARVNAESAAEGIAACEALKPLADCMVNPLAKYEAGRSRVDDNPVVFLIGDSTVRNYDEDKENDQWGWGRLFAEKFDPAKITVENHAMAGRSARTFVNEERWNAVYKALRPGDFVIIQFGHNDAGAIDSGRERASLPGVSAENKVYKMASNGRYEVVRTYGWYIEKMVNDALERGAIPILLSRTPRNIFNEGKIENVTDSFGQWTAEIANRTGAIYLDFNTEAGKELQALTREKVDAMFKKDHTHASYHGAALNSALLARLLKGVNHPLSKYMKNEETN